MDQPENDSQPSYKTFNDFYPFYLSQHANPKCRQLHFAGPLVIIVFLVITFMTQDMRWLFMLPISGYGFAWFGHFMFEKNRPATFSYPFFSLAGDWVMFWQILTGKISMRESD